MIPLGEFDEYLPIIERAAREYGDDTPDFLSMLGSAESRAGDFDLAVSTLERALAIKEDGDFRASLAYAQWRSGKTEAALTNLRKLQGDGGADTVLVAVLKSEKRLGEIEELLEDVKRPDPRRVSGIDYWCGLAGAYFESMRRWDDTVAVFEEAKASGKMTWVTYEEKLLAVRLRRAGRIPEARALLEKCLDSCPAEARVEAHEELAFLEAIVGNPRAAVDHVEQAAAIDHWSDNHRVLAARLLYARGREGEAAGRLRQLQGQIGWAFTAYHACQLRSELGIDESPGGCWGPVADRATLRANSSIYWQWSAAQALSLARTGDEAAARHSIDWALKLEPELAEVAYRAAGVYALLGDSEEALQWLRTAIERESQELWWARVDPDLDPLRDDPRFKRLMSAWEARLEPLLH
jgi:tetratricopeptide (TPR) repeat protein